MKEPISRYFQMGTLTWMSFPSLSTLEAVKRVAADEYFTTVEVRSCRDDAEREEVRRVLEQAHLTVYYGAHPDLLSMKLNPNAVDEADARGQKHFKARWMMRHPTWVPGEWPFWLENGRRKRRSGRTASF